MQASIRSSFRKAAGRVTPVVALALAFGAISYPLHSSVAVSALITLGVGIAGARTIAGTGKPQP